MPNSPRSHDDEFPHRWQTHMRIPAWIRENHMAGMNRSISSSVASLHNGSCLLLGSSTGRKTGIPGLHGIPDPPSQGRGAS